MAEAHLPPAQIAASWTIPGPGRLPATTLTALRDTVVFVYRLATTAGAGGAAVAEPARVVRSRRAARRRGRRCRPCGFGRGRAPLTSPCAWSDCPGGVTARTAVGVRCRRPTPGCSRCAAGRSVPAVVAHVGGDEHDERDVVTPGDTGLPDVRRGRRGRSPGRSAPRRSRATTKPRGHVELVLRLRPRHVVAVGTTTHGPATGTTGSGPGTRWSLLPAEGATGSAPSTSAPRSRRLTPPSGTRAPTAPGADQQQHAPPPANRSVISRVCRLCPSASRVLVDLAQLLSLGGPEELRRRWCSRSACSVCGLGGTRIGSVYPPGSWCARRRWACRRARCTPGTCSCLARCAAASGAVWPPSRAPSEISSTASAECFRRLRAACRPSARRGGSRRRSPCPRPA